MAITKTWSITDLEREISDNYICWVHWCLKGTEGDKTVEITGQTKLERPDTLVDYATLTEETVLGWVKAKINSEAAAVIDEETGKTAIERTEDRIDKKMAALNAPETATGKPF